MNVRLSIITASLAVGLAVPVAALGAGSRSPVHNHATTSDSSVSYTVRSQSETGAESTVSKLRDQLRKADRRAAKLGAQLRVARYGSTQLRAQLRAAKRLVSELRIQLSDAISRLSVSTGSSSGGNPSGSGTHVPDCTANIDDCTSEELCTFWGMNCDQVPAPEAPVPATPTDPAQPETQGGEAAA